MIRNLSVARPEAKGLSMPKAKTRRTCQVIYTRSCTTGAGCNNCASQERRIRAGLKRNGVDPSLAIVIKEEGISGLDTKRRGWRQILAMINEGRPLDLVVTGLSRLSRGMALLPIINRLVANGGRFIALDENIDTKRKGWKQILKRIDRLRLTNVRSIFQLYVKKKHSPSRIAERLNDRAHFAQYSRHRRLGERHTRRR